MNLEEIGCKVLDRIHLTQDRVQGQALVNIAKLQTPQETT
jgi:hypothetical protein